MVVSINGGTRRLLDGKVLSSDIYSSSTSLDFLELPDLQTPAATEEIAPPSNPSSQARELDIAEHTPDLIALYFSLRRKIATITDD